MLLVRRCLMNGIKIISTRHLKWYDRASIQSEGGGGGQCNDVYQAMGSSSDQTSIFQSHSLTLRFMHLFLHINFFPEPVMHVQTKQRGGTAGTQLRPAQGFTRTQSKSFSFGFEYFTETQQAQRNGSVPNTLAPLPFYHSVHKELYPWVWNFPTQCVPYTCCLPLLHTHAKLTDR